jgi:hypothetical protein
MGETMQRAAFSVLVGLVLGGLVACGGGDGGGTTGGDTTAGDTAGDTAGTDAVDDSAVDDTAGGLDTAGGDDTGGTPDASTDLVGPGGLVYDEAGWARAIPKEGQTWTYRVSGIDVQAVFTRTDDTLGAPMALVSGGNFDAAGNPIIGLRAWIDLSTPWRMSVPRIEMYQNAVSATEPSFTYTYDPPLTLQLDLQLGETTTFAYTCTMTFASGEPIVNNETVEWELLDGDATVVVPYGTVEGCLHFRARTSFPDEGADAHLDSEFWYHPELGPIKDTDKGFELVSFGD